jgi:transposase
MFGRSDYLSVPTCLDLKFLSSVRAPFLCPGLNPYRAPVAATVKRSAQPRGATRSRLFAASMASTASTGP